MIDSITENNCTIKILHVDDESIFLETTKEILEMDADFYVTSVNSVEKAQKLISKQYFDVIVSDYQMPVKDGLTFLAELRNNSCLTPFILFTGKGREDVAIKALNLGANQYISKVGRPETVYGELSHYIKQITKKTRSEKLLEEYEERLRKIASQTPGMLYQFKMNSDGSYCVPFSTDGIIDVFGVIPDDVKTNFSPILDVIYPADIEGLIKSILDSAKNLKTWRFEFRVQQPNKSIQWMLGNSQPEKLKDGSILWSGYCVDITEQKNALKRVELQRKMLEILTRNTRSGLSIISKKFEVIYANKILNDVFGDVIGKKCYAAIGGRKSICPDCGVKKIFENNDKQVVHTKTIQDQNGNDVYLELVATAVEDKNGKIMGATEISLNITEQKLRENKIRESEQKFRMLAEQSPNMIFINQKGKIVYANKKCEELMGYSKEELYSADFDYNNLIAPQDKGRVASNFARHSKNLDVPPLEYSIITKEGKQLEAILSTTIISYNGENAILGTITDITDRKKAEEKIDFALEKLQTLNEKMNIVGKSTRHDVSNKLAVILNETYLAKMKLTPTQKDLKESLDSIEKTVDAINRIFDFSRIYQQLGSEELINLDVGKIFDEALSHFLSGNDLFVINECRGLHVVADSLLKTFFYNLIENSLKHGQKVTSIGLRWVDLETELLIIYEDNGVGIFENEKDKIFSEGYGKGTGMGLYLITLMCKVYGWNIKEAGEPQQGAQFIITIPKQKLNTKLKKPLVT